MRSKTSKYTALAIIVIGILFIYFIPLFFGTDNYVKSPPMVHNFFSTPTLESEDKNLSNAQSESKSESRPDTSKKIIQSKYAGIEGELKRLFDEAEVIYLVDGIKIAEKEYEYAIENMYATIVGIINKNNIPIKYEIGNQELIGIWVDAPQGAIIPEAALVFQKHGSDNLDNLKKEQTTVYFNYGKLASIYNGYTFEYIKEIFDKNFKNLKIKPVDSNNKLQELFDKADVIYLGDNIKINNEKMYVTIVGLINKIKAPINYKIGDNKFVRLWTSGPEDAKIPESEITFINYIDGKSSSTTLFFNYGKLGPEFDGYTLEYVKEIFKQNDKCK